MFPSPYGDKFQLKEMKIEVIEIGFRPLTGINFNFMSKVWLAVEKGFRPLTGINFNS